ncbi:MAG: formate dehydrogenase subunit delta [Aliidongia sp.]
MVNQIALFFQSSPRDEAVSGIASHLKQFWEPRMLRQLHAYITAGGAGLHELVLDAEKTLQ